MINYFEKRAMRLFSKLQLNKICKVTSCLRFDLSIYLSI